MCFIDHHEWIEMSASILAVVPERSLHVDVEPVLALRQAEDHARDEDCAAGVALLHVERSVDSAVSARHEVNLSHAVWTAVVPAAGPAAGVPPATAAAAAAEATTEGGGLSVVGASVGVVGVW